MNEAYIFETVRTPRGRGRPDGSLHEVHPVDLLAGLMTGLQERCRFDTAQVEDALIGCSLPFGEQGGSIARTAVLRAGWGTDIPGVQLNRYCGSSLEALNIAVQKVRSGWEHLLLAGGVESMSRTPLGTLGPYDTKPALVYRDKGLPTGVAADLMASLDGHSREAVDDYALRSQQRASRAMAAGWFDRSVLPVRDFNGLTILDRDELVRPGTTMEKLAALAPAFKTMGEQGGFDALALMKYPQLESIAHVHTGGNSSGIVDGASLALVGSERKGQELGLVPRARVLSVGVVGGDSTIMLAGPAPATRLALKRAGLRIEDIDLIEVNEAFSSVVLRFISEMKVDPEIVNVNGGAIALGHPLGATGCMLVGTLLDELERRHLKRGLVTLCIAGGMGIATIIERV